LGNTKDFEIGLFLSHSLSFKAQNVYHRHIHTFTFKTAQKQKSLKVYCAYSNNGKNVKITETVAIALKKHPAKFGIKEVWRRSVMTVFISPGPRQHFCFSNPSENAHAFSCALPIAK